jgi:hypothetical protein
MGQTLNGLSSGASMVVHQNNPFLTRGIMLKHSDNPNKVSPGGLISSISSFNETLAHC